MMAGILLGPSLFGLLAPKAFLFVFAPASLDTLRLFSQIGVCIFMFAVGMELDLSQLRHSAHRFLVIGHSSILIPYLFGVVLALSLYSNYAQAGLLYGLCTHHGHFHEHHRLPGARPHFAGSQTLRTKLGQTATLCAAIGDVTAWCILAFVVAIAGTVNVKSAAFSLALVGVYAVTMILAIKPLLRRFLKDRFWTNRSRPKESWPWFWVLSWSPR